MEITNYDILEAIDPNLKKLVELANKIKQSKSFAEKVKIMCEAGMITFDELCSKVDQISVLPPDQQKKALQALILRDVLKRLRRSKQEAIER